MPTTELECNVGSSWYVRKPVAVVQTKSELYLVGLVRYMRHN